MKKIFSIIICLLLILISLYLGRKLISNFSGDKSITNTIQNGQEGNNSTTEADDKESENEKENIGTEDDVDNKEKIEEDIIEKQIKNMSLKEKIGQLFIVAFRSNLKGEPLHYLDDYTRHIIEEYNPGGIILFSQNIDSIQQTKKLIEEFKLNAKVPMFIAIDEEGGKVSRLNSSGKMHATKLPGNQLIGKTGETELAFRTGVLIAEELSSLGFNMNFAPVADVNTNPKNPVIGSRSFGSEPGLVGEMVVEMVRGMQSKSICTVLKHFPGHGDTSQDSHNDAVVLNHNRERLDKVEFIPFIKGIEAGTDGIMTAHIQIPEITGESIPATLSPEILTGILRNEMNFDNLIITDALEMKAISKYWSPAEASVAAFKAGADILLMPGSLSEAFNAILDAINKGEIPVERLDDSVRRILRVKRERNILNPIPNLADPEKILGSEEHLELVREIKVKAEK